VIPLLVATVLATSLFPPAESLTPKLAEAISALPDVTFISVVIGLGAVGVFALILSASSACQKYFLSQREASTAMLVLLPLLLVIVTAGSYSRYSVNNGHAQQALGVTQSEVAAAKDGHFTRPEEIQARLLKPEDSGAFLR